MFMKGDVVTYTMQSFGCNGQSGNHTFNPVFELKVVAGYSFYYRILFCCHEALDTKMKINYLLFCHFLLPSTIE